MKVRIIGAILALLLAAIGTVVLMSYVRGADARAAAGIQTVEVLAVGEAVIAAGTPAEELDALVAVATVPARSVVVGGVESIDQLAGLVATVDLQPGEQLLASRFAAQADVQDQGRIEVPAGLQQVTISLEPQRVIGGQLMAGDTVGVFISDPTTVTTHLVLHKVLVTTVQGLPAPPVPAEGEDEAPPEEENSASAPLPEGSLFVTLALDAPAAERLVFGMEYGTVWLSAEPAEATEDGTTVMTWEQVYQ